jgi:hypothetical protein
LNWLSKKTETAIIVTHLTNHPSAERQLPGRFAPDHGGFNHLGHADNKKETLMNQGFPLQSVGIVKFSLKKN